MLTIVRESDAKTATGEFHPRGKGRPVGENDIMNFEDFKSKIRRRDDYCRDVTKVEMHD